MAKNNTEQYERILSALESGATEYSDADGFYSLNTIETVVTMLTDKIRPETIERHIKVMVGAKLLIKRGEIHYKLNPNWRELIKIFEKKK